MCTGAEIIPLIAAIGGAASAGVGIANAVKGAPKIPAPPASVQSPTTDVFRKKNAAAFSPGAALASAFGGGSGPSQSVGTSTLLGQ